MIWTAIIIASVSIMPMYNAVPGDANRDKVIGVESITTVSSPVMQTIAFPSKELCESAKEALKTDHNIATVVCVQTQ